MKLQIHIFFLRYIHIFKIQLHNIHLKYIYIFMHYNITRKIEFSI